MTRQESDREDLIKEATAYRTRAEFAVQSAQTVFVGIRRDEVMAIYFDQDPMYQFDANGRIRRALVDGVLFRAQGETLSRLSRQRREQETVLERTDLSSDELTAFLDTMDDAIHSFVNEIDNGSAVIQRAVPSDTETDIPERVKQQLLNVLSTSPRIAPPINSTR